MVDDGSGASIRIPSYFISQKDGDFLKTAVQKEEELRSGPEDVLNKGKRMQNRVMLRAEINIAEKND